MTEARELEKDLSERSGEKLRGKLVFHDHAIGQRSDEITDKTIKSLQDAATATVENIESATAENKSDIQLMADAASQQKRDATFEELEPLREQSILIRNEVNKEYEPLAKWLEKLRDPIETDALTVLS